ncbi:MAG: Gfo/Idh/MocA family oxidoreductase [Candidatus Lokiarchaeota archaeon]|nr:Gfo/Idh/MocA family oxidoreductase [Candidatus Lokiarchaeota archaeon]
MGYAKNPDCDLVAIASRTANHAKIASERFSIPNVYVGGESWKNLLDKEELDIVSICTPNYLHAPIVLKAIENDCNILCEKPIAISRKELSQIEEKLENKTLIFFTSFQKRYNPIFRLIKGVLDNGIIGKITSVRYIFSHYGPYKSWKALSEEKWFFDSTKAGGGVLLDLGVHCIDILRYLLGEYDKVNGINFNTSCINMEDDDNSNVLFRFKNDVLGLISVSWCNEPSETLDIFGTEGFIKVDISGRNPLSFGPKNLKRNKLIKNLLKFKPIHESAQNKLIDHFINCIQTKKQESPNFEDGKRAVEFVLDAYSLKE